VTAITLSVTVITLASNPPNPPAARADQSPNVRKRRTTMLAEIYLLRLQTLVRSTSPFPNAAASNPRFIPISLPRT
jgi:hypothetical protein